MVALLGVVLLPLLLLAVLQAVYRQSAALLVRVGPGPSAAGPPAHRGSGELVQLVLAATDALCTTVAAGSGTDLRTALQATGQRAVGTPPAAPGSPAFVVLLGALLVALGAFALWVELLVRAAAVYVAVLFLPLALASLVWPAISHWCRRLVDTLAALVLAKFVIVAILSLAVGGPGVGQQRGRAPRSWPAARSCCWPRSPRSPCFGWSRWWRRGRSTIWKGPATGSSTRSAPPPTRCRPAMRQLRAQSLPPLSPGTGLDEEFEPAGTWLRETFGEPGNAGAPRGATRVATSGGAASAGGPTAAARGEEGPADPDPESDPDAARWRAWLDYFLQDEDRSDLADSPIPMMKGVDVPPVGYLRALEEDFHHDAPLRSTGDDHPSSAAAGSTSSTPSGHHPLLRVTASTRSGRTRWARSSAGGPTPLAMATVPAGRPCRPAHRGAGRARAAMPEGPRYRFGPLERRGVVAGWRGGQIASVAVGLVVAVLALRARPSIPGIVVAAVAVGASVALACWPVSGRTGEEWLPTLARWLAARAAGRGTRRSGAPGVGTLVGDPDDAPDGPAVGEPGPAGRDRPPAATGPVAVGRSGPRRVAMFGHRARAPGAFAGLALLEGGGESGPGPVAEAAGVVFDAAAGTYSAVLAVRGHSFSLLGPLDKERRVNAWSSVLAALARQGSLVHRLQWVARTLPDDGRGIAEHLRERAARSEGDRARRSYAALLADAGAGACRHEVLLCVQLASQRATARAVRAAGGGRRGACAVLFREVAAVRSLLADADVEVATTLGPAALARCLRGSTEPAPLADPPDAPGGATRGDCWPWPMAVDNAWGEVRTDATWHRTYWVAEWPRVEVGPEFLGPLLLGGTRRSLSVVMEPLSPLRAARQVEQARTADLADAELRRRGGFLATARRNRESQVVVQREHELADGHGSYRYSGYVTVTATSLGELERAGEATEQAAGQAHLELRRLYGDQERAFTCTLPLGRGLT